MKTALTTVLLACAALPLTAPATPGPSTGEPKLADLAWMAGHWGGEVDGTRTEEVWLAPAGGFLLGMNRSAPKSGRGEFEFLRIEERADGIVYVASPGGKGATDFPLSDLGQRFVEFANPEHDFPKHLRYELDAAGALHAKVWGDDASPEAALQWTWKRQ